MGRRKRFGDALEEARRAAGLTQEQLAVKAEVSTGTVSRLERGDTPSPRIVRKLTAHLPKLAEFVQSQQTAA